MLHLRYSRYTPDLNACYAILYPKGIDSGIQAINKTNKLLSVLTV